MSSWLSSDALAGLRRVDVTRVEVEGTPSCVTRATFALHYADGRVVLRTAAFPEGVIYESFVLHVRAANRLLRG